MKRKVRETYKQTYRKGVFCAPGAVPPLSSGAVIKAVELKAAGHCELDGERLEFVDVRLYVLP